MAASEDEDSDTAPQKVSEYHNTHRNDIDNARSGPPHQPTPNMVVWRQDQEERFSMALEEALEEEIAKVSQLEFDLCR